MSEFRVGDLAARVGGTVEGDPEAVVTGIAPVEEAGPGDLTFVTSRAWERALSGARPTAILAPEGLLADGAPAEALIRVRDPQVAVGRLLPLFYPGTDGDGATAGVHPTAVLGEGVRLGESVAVGAYSVLEAGCEIGDGTVLGPHVHVGPGAVIGRACAIDGSATILGSVHMGDRVRVHPGVRLGTDGYGYGEEEGRPVKIPQVGRCVIGDDVEIGANSTVDRGALGDTVIGAGTKLDNLVHVGHNVRIGENCMIVAQVGVAGSTEIGDRVQLAGQAGIAGHLSIGEGARIAAQAGVIGDVPAGATYSGYPARPHSEAMRASAALFRLPELLRRVHRLEHGLEEAPDREAGANGADDPAGGAGENA